MDVHVHRSSHSEPLVVYIGLSRLKSVFDILHCLDLGVYQVAVPSAMKELTARKGVWPGNTIAARFKAASTDYKVWRQQKRIRSYMPKPFVKKALVSF